MNKSTIARISGIAAAIALTATMTACTGGQSVADACKVAQDEITKASSSVTSDLSSSMQKATQGEKVDFKAMFQPILDGLDAAEKKVTNEKVKAPLSAFTAEYKNFVKVFDGYEVPDLASLDPSDPTAMDKINEVQKKSQEIATKGQDASTKLMDQATKLQSVCTAG